MPFRLGFYFLLLLVLLPSGAARADDPYVCDAGCRALIYDWVVADVEHFAPDNRLPSERFDTDMAGKACSVERGPEPKVHAIVLAPLYPHYQLGTSTTNNANLLANFFADAGVDAAFTTIVTGQDVTRAKMIETLSTSLNCVRERDQVVLVMTGNAASYDRWVAPSFEFLTGYMCAPEDKNETLQALCAAAGNLPEEAKTIIEGDFRQALSDHDQIVFFSSETKVDLENGRNDPDMRLIGLGALELSNYVAQVRNRGADAFVVIDASYAAAFNLLELQRDSVPDGGWFWNAAQEDEPTAQDVNPRLVPVYGSGHFAVFYSAASDQMTSEVQQSGDDALVGPLILSFSEALRENPDLSLSQLAMRVTASMKELELEETPVFASSSTALRFLAPASAAATAPQAIEIISPAPTRGAAAIEEKSFTLVARYSGNAKAFKAVVDGDIVNVDANGQFRQEIKDTGGKLAIQIRVLGQNFETLAASELKLREAEDEPIVATAARKLALVIANQNYGSEAFAPLKTPLADAEAVVAILKQRYGFATEIGSGKDALNLFLKDASKAQIQQVLFELRRRLTPEDQLLIYYAGHGENDPDLGAFWVPADGQPKADFTWIAAEEITRELKRMNAGSILVISDSCYAGGLSRGGAGEKVPDEARDRYLAKASRLKSRQLMASGGVEPVADGGGSGHSVFAKALIESLKSMPEQTFTASELFEQKVKPAMIAAANALTEGQTPGFNRIVRAGDEPGSEFVFQAVQ